MTKPKKSKGEGPKLPYTRRELLEMTVGELILVASMRGHQAIIHPIAWDDPEKPGALIALAFGEEAVAEVFEAYKAVSDANKARRSGSMTPLPLTPPEVA